MQEDEDFDYGANGVGRSPEVASEVNVYTSAVLNEDDGPEEEILTGSWEIASDHEDGQT